MKYIGIDFGSKRVGVAISDEDGKIAFPKLVLNNDKNLISNLTKIIKEEQVGHIVVGESVNQDGENNLIQSKIEEFIDTLDSEINLPIAREKEFFTSFEAHLREGKEQMNARQNKKERTENLDSKSASLILQRYLDKINK